MRYLRLMLRRAGLLIAYPFMVVACLAGAVPWNQRWIAFCLMHWHDTFWYYWADEK